MGVIRDLGSIVTPFAAAGGRLVAAGAGDNTKVTGASINRMPAGAQEYLSGLLVICGTSTVANAQTLKFAVEEEQSDDGSVWTNTTTIQAATTVVNGVTTAAAFVFALAINLAGKKAFVRYNPTPDLSAGATDTAEWGATLVCAGTKIPTP